MSDLVPLDEFISLGRSLCVVANPQPWHAKVVSDEIAKLLHQLTLCGMRRARVAAEPLDGVSIPYNSRSGFIGAVALKEIEAHMKSVSETLYAEAREQQVVAIDTGAVTQRLRNVQQQLTLTKSQLQLQQETILCLERGAYRAAIVMAWCFAYDCMRWWVFNDSQRLQQFNIELARYCRRNGGARLYDDIVAYDDFYSNKAPAEGSVIETIESSGLIGGKLSRNLRHYLDVRNDYAHATAATPSANQANAFVEQLLDIITASPFR